MGGEHRAERLGLPAQLALEVAGHRHNGWRGIAVGELANEGKLAVPIEGGLQHDDATRLPGSLAGRLDAHGLEGDADPPGDLTNALSEKQIVLDYKQSPSHPSRITGWARANDALAIAKSDLALAIIARGKVGSKAERIAPDSEIQSQEKGDSS
jgi:hypothetical protein